MSSRRSLLLLSSTVLAVGLLAACSGSSPDSSPSSKNVPSSSSPSSPSSPSLPSPPGEWSTVGTITKETAAQDPTVKEIQSFLQKPLTGGTLTLNMPGDNEPPYATEASSEGDRFFSVTRSGTGEDRYQAGDAERWCAAYLPAGETPTVEDWNCGEGSPDGGNEYELILAYFWLGMDPTWFVGDEEYSAKEGLLERNGNTIRLTLDGYQGRNDKAILIYDLDTNTITQGWVSGDDGYMVASYSPDLPEWPDLPSPSTPSE